MKRIFLCLFVISAVVSACVDDNDSFSSSRTDLLFSVDTLRMDTVFSTVGSSTYSFWVFNPTDQGIRLPTVRLRNGNQTGFRVNVDGTYLDHSTGSVVSGLEIRGGDSIRVFVELTASGNGHPAPRQLQDDLVFKFENGTERSVVLSGCAWDAVAVRNLVISHDTVIESSQPIVVYGDGLKVDSCAVLTLRNSTLYFHDGAGITVAGTLLADHVLMRGDRLDHMFSSLPYDNISGQWRGITFRPSSTGNLLRHTEIRNATDALVVDSAALDCAISDAATLKRDTLLNRFLSSSPDANRLTLDHCIIHNAKGYGLLAHNATVYLSHCQFSNTLNDCLALYGGCALVHRSTLAQFYPFSANRGAAIRFVGQGKMILQCDSTIVTGYDSNVVAGLRQDTTTVFQYRFRDCLLRTPEVTDDSLSFRRIRWELPTDSVQGSRHFLKIDEDSLRYDFHLDSISTAKGWGAY